MHEWKLEFEKSGIKLDVEKNEGDRKKEKLLVIDKLFTYPIQMLVPNDCIGLKVYAGDAKEGSLISTLKFDFDNHILNEDGTIVGEVQ